MVPMLTCGLVRSNFAFATGGPPNECGASDGALGGLDQEPGRAGLLAAGLRDDLEGDILRDLRVGVELHRVAGPTLRLAAEIPDVAEHLRKAYEGRDDPGPRAFVHGLDVATAAVEVADD